MARLCHLAGKPAPMSEIIRIGKRRAYLGDVSKIRAALANEYGSDRRLPSAATIQGWIDERRGRK